MRNLTLEKVVKFAIGMTGIAVILMILYNYATLVGFLVLALILSYILDPFANRLQAIGLNRTLGITLILATVILIIVFISTSVIPIVANQMAELAAQLNINNIQEIAVQVENRLTPRNLSLYPKDISKKT